MSITKNFLFNFVAYLFKHILHILNCCYHLRLLFLYSIHQLILDPVNKLQKLVIFSYSGLSFIVEDFLKLYDFVTKRVNQKLSRFIP